MAFVIIITLFYCSLLVCTDKNWLVSSHFFAVFWGVCARACVCVSVCDGLQGKKMATPHRIDGGHEEQEGPSQKAQQK